MNLALKEGGCLTWITILNNFEIVKRGGGLDKKKPYTDENLLKHCVIIIKICI